MGSRIFDRLSGMWGRKSPEKTFVQSCFGIEAPRVVARLSIVHSQKKIQLRIEENAKQRSLHKKGRAGALECRACEVMSGEYCVAREYSWKHFKIGEYGTVIFAKIMVYKRPCGEPNCRMNLPWLGQPGSPLTTALAHDMLEMLSIGLRYSAVCEYFGVTLDEAWTTKKRFDEGKLGVATEKISPAITSEKETQVIEVADSILPVSSAPVWVDLLSLESGFKTRSVSLSMLINRTRRQYALLQDEESKRLKLNEIRHFFIKHEKILTSEIDQLMQDAL